MNKLFSRVVALFLVCTFVLNGNGITSLAYGEVEVESEYSLSMEEAKTDEYKSWKETTWTDAVSSDSGKILLTPGSDSSQMNVAWYSKKKGSAWIKIGTNPDLKDGVMYQATSTAMNRKNWANTYKACNKATIKKLNSNSTYYYTYSREPDKVYSFKTQSTENFKVLVMGDPQIGASGTKGEGTKSDVNIPADAYAWERTLNKAIRLEQNASFIMSVGDQINYKDETVDKKGVRESEYAGFLYPEVLRSMPIAPAIGNHESKGVDLKYHFNLPNSKANYGATNSGSDYYYRYGNALFIVLNSNSRKMAEHKKTMKEAVESFPDAKWRIVMFHHDIYGSGVLHSNGSSANLRILFAPLMDEYLVDLVLSGHDHSYARSYQMLDGTAINYGAFGATDPVGTLYVAVGSSTGSKFYGLAAKQQYYVAERSNAQIQTFTTLEIGDSQLKIQTRDINGNSYARDYVLTKTKAKENPLSWIRSLSKVKKENYTKASFQAFSKQYKKVKSTINLTSTDKGYTTLVKKNGKSGDPLTYYSNAQSAYKNPSFGRNLLKNGFSTLLDKTIKKTPRISKTKFQNVYTKLKETHKDLERTSLTIKKGKKKLTSKTVVSLKRKKSFRIKVTRSPKSTKNKVTFSSSAKKYVAVNKNGKVTAKKKTKKPVTITVKFENRKKTFRVKVR